MNAVRYFARLSRRQQAMWCYLLWYLTVVATHFDPSPRLWATAAGLSVVIGTLLTINANVSLWRSSQRWQTLRFFAIPFCVSSFAATAKNRPFILIFPTEPGLLARSLGACLGFLIAVAILRRMAPARSRRIQPER